MDERRGRGRYAIWFPMKIDAGSAGDAVAISRNVSEKGLLMATAHKLVVGAPISVTFRLSPDDPEERTVEGVIVRREDNAEDPDGLWPHRVAVQFDEDVTDLAPLLRQHGQALETPEHPTRAS